MSTGGCATVASRASPAPATVSPLSRALLPVQSLHPAARTRSPPSPRFRPVGPRRVRRRSGGSYASRIRRRLATAPRPAAVVLGASALLAATALAPPTAKLIAPSPAVAGAREDVNARLTDVRDAVAVYREYTPSEIFSYKIQKVFGLPLFGKIMCLFILTVPIVIIGGLAYKLVDAMDGTDSDGDGEADGWTDKLRSRAYYNLFDIRALTPPWDESWRSFAVTQAIVVTGIFVVAVIIGIISDEIATKVEEVKTGNSRVIEAEHGGRQLELATRAPTPTDGCRKVRARGQLRQTRRSPRGHG